MSLIHVPVPRLCLLVDDSAAIRRIAAGMVQELGYVAAQAADGREALEICREFVPDIILLDWNMPGMDGLTYLRHLRAIALPCQPKVVLCTTENRLARIMAALAAGADEYIMKPFDRDILRDKLVQIGLDQAPEEAA